MPNQTPLNPDAPDSQVSEYQRVEVIETPARDYPSHGSVTIRLYHSERQSTAIQIAERTAESLRDQLNGYVAVAQPESEDERIPAWQAVANHPAFNDCYEEERPLLESMLDHLTELTAQPVVNSVEGIPAQVQVISWEEEPEHECWKLAPDETFVGLIVKSDRAWSPADKYTLNIQRPEVDDA